MPKLLTMHVDLFDQGDATTPDGTPLRAWQVIEAARRRYLTGLLVLETTPPTHVYLRDGQVYFAERTTDGGVAVRLLVEGVITRAQMQKATLQVSGVEHLGRMFERDDSIDRDAVELCVELMTDDVLTHIAQAEVSGWDMRMYQRHPSGLDRWLPTRVEVITHLIESAAAVDPEVAPTPAPAPRPRPQLAPPPITGQVPVAATEQMNVAELIAAADLVAGTESTDPTPLAMQRPDALPTERTAEYREQHLEPPPSEPTQAEPTQAEPTQAEADEIAPVEEQALTGLAPSAMESLMSGSIKDEVAEAVRRALAGIDH
jgi:hypothetical protein